MHFCFHRSFVTVWGMPEISRAIAGFFEHFTLLRYIQGSSWEVYKLLLQVGLGLTTFVLFNMIFVSIASKRKMTGLALSIQTLQVLIWVLTRILYLPLFQLFISIFHCAANPEGDETHFLFPEVYCYSGEHLVYAIIIGVASVVLAVVSLVTGYLYFEKNLDSADIMAC